MVLSSGSLPVLLSVLHQHSLPPATKAKALYAISAVVRSYRPALEALEAEDGVAGVVHLLNDADADSVMKRKAATFVTDIVTDRPSFADKLVKLGVCEGILPLLQSNETAVQEKAMEALETLIGAAPSTARLLNTLEAKKSLAELRARTDEAAKADPELVEHIFRHLDVLHGMLTNNP
mmetsp:Transcript_25979/g.59888  ORF Transcript_25979/g.59888 Transcript_25979/m.59888 type:complete len:178 (+) Transcript_25979:3-536(+)